MAEDRRDVGEDEKVRERLDEAADRVDEEGSIPDSTRTAPVAGEGASVEDRRVADTAPVRDSSTDELAAEDVDDGERR